MSEPRCFCGGIPKIAKDPYLDYFQVRCEKCGRFTEVARSEADALKEWNNSNYDVAIKFGRDIVEKFENLLELKDIVIPCDNEGEETDRYSTGSNAASIYGSEYWDLCDSVAEIILDICLGGDKS